MTAGNEKWANCRYGHWEEINPADLGPEGLSNSGEWVEVDSADLDPAICGDSNATLRRARYRLGIADNAIMLSVYKRPNPWYRFWQRVLLDWKWEEIMD